ncbi:hypothetical protein NF681_09775 [Comamonadaceae bacterium OTU4NAUVB1]|jgi:nicotinamide mononucleotide (NMN) deamidase PncC|nr:hypothetical protein NF681_09775 [Comamonadaceae bacterium OTU4NAUVB1]
MKTKTNTKRANALGLLLICAGPPLWAASPAPAPLGVVQVGSAHRDDIRRTVERHRDAQREEIRRGELAAGRRLTARELLELRAQVRQQSQPAAAVSVPPHAGADGDVQASPVGLGPATVPLVPTSSRSSLTMPRSQRQP